MDMNLNISTLSINSFQENSSNAGNMSNENEFEGLLEGLKGDIEELDLDSNLKDEDGKEIIDYSLIQNILNNLQIINQIENKDEINILDGKIDGDLGDLIDEIKNQSTDIKSNNIIDKLLEKLVENKEMKLNESDEINSELLNSIKESLKDLKNNKVSKNDNKLESKLLNTLSEQVQDKSENNYKGDYFNINIENKVDEHQYESLEISSLSNKISILQQNESNSSNKELNTLEEILGENNNKQFMFPNNVNTTTVDFKSEDILNNEPIKEIREAFIGKDVVKTVRYLKANGLEEINIKISPRELGEMTIKLVKNLDETKVAITVSKDDVFDLVNKNVSDIVKHLNDLNIKVKEVSVDIKNENQKLFSDNLNKEFDRKNHKEQKRKNNYKSSGIEDIEDIIESKIEEDNLNVLI